VANRTGEQTVEAIAALRRLRFTGPEISELLGGALSTVSGILTRIGMGRLGRLGLEPACRYERERPGELIHIDIAKTGARVRTLTSGTRDSQPSWSPDGRRIAFTRRHSLYVVPAAGGKARRIVASGVQPVWVRRAGAR
jgi:hypothetical protein